MPRTRKDRTHFVVFLSFLFFIIIFTPARGSETTVNNNYFESLQEKLITDGFDEYEIKAIYIRPEVSFETRGVSLFFMHSEDRLDYNQYTVKQQIKKARRYMANYNEELSQAEKVYGVDKEVITAIILIETQCGTLLGTRSILNTLSTMASLFDLQVREMLWQEISDIPELTRHKFEKKAERKSRWAYRELTAFLNYVIREGIDPVEVNGSYAGAMGISQFMPSNIPALAKDGNNDGRIDLFDHADAIASIAFFLKRHGWKPGISKNKAQKVIHHYNHSDQYVDAVLKISKLLKG